MPDGFVGNASGRYLSTVNGALSEAAATHSKDPFGGSSGGAVPPPSLPPRDNARSRYSAESAKIGGHITGVGNASNVVVSENAYADMLQRIRVTDARIAEDLYNIAVRIEEMCDTIYIVPATLPKFLSIINNVKSTLGEFQSLAERAGATAYEFMGEIMRIDSQ